MHWDHLQCCESGILPGYHQNPRWPPSMWYGSANFFPMGDKFKILFSRIWFWHTGNAMKPFRMLCARYFCQIRRIWRFSAVFTHFCLMYHYFEAWNIIHATIVMFWVQRIKWRNIENCQTTRVARLRGISTAICYFSADFKHFPSIYKYFDFRQVILVAIPIPLRTKNLIVTFRKLLGLPWLPGCAVF